jgi:hypothetical protein
LSKEAAQDEVDVFVFILGCLAERLEVGESQGKSRISFNHSKTPHYDECSLLCSGRTKYRKIKTIVDRQLDQILKVKQR